MTGCVPSDLVNGVVQNLASLSFKMTSNSRDVELILNVRKAEVGF